MSSFQQKILLDAAGQSRPAFIARLRAAGFVVVGLPTPAAVPLPDTDGLIKAIDAISLYSAILFHDRATVQIFRSLIDACGLGPDDLPPAWCLDAAGLADARAAGIATEPLACAPDAKEFPREFGHVENQYFLMLSGDDDYAGLAVMFRDRDAKLNVVRLYATQPPKASAIRAVDDQLVDGAIDCIAFFDPAEVRRFVALIPEFKQATVLIAVGDLGVATAVMTAGLRVDIIPDDASDDACADAIITRLQSSDGGIEYNPGEIIDFG